MLPDKDKTIVQSTGKLKELRQKVGEFEILESGLEFAENEIRQSEEKYQRLFELSPMGIVVLDMKGVITACNSAVCTKSGYSKDDFIGKHFLKVATIRAGDIPKFMKIFASLIRGKIPKPLEVIYTRKDGTTGWTEAHISLLKVSGNKIGIQVIQNDITERKQMEEALKESHGFIEKVTDSLPDVLYVYDLFREENVYASKSLNNVLGYTPEEFKAMGDTVLGRLFHPDDLEPFMEYLEKLKTVKGNEVYEYEYRMKHKDGHWVWIQNRDMIFARDSKGKPLQTIGTAADITERKGAEEFIRTQAEVTKNMAEGAYIIGLHDVIIRWASPKFEAVFGYEPGEMIGKHASIVNAPTDLTPMQRADEIMEVIRRTGEWHGEVNSIKKDGTPFWCYASVSTFTHSEYGGVLLAVHTDITERKQAEQALKESEARYRGLVEGALDVIFTISVDGRLTSLNPAFEIITGWPCAEWIGKPFASIVHPDDLPIAEEAFQSGLQAELRQSYEVRIPAKSGEYLLAEIKGGPQTESGAVVGVWGMARDITERKRAEEELRESEERYRALMNLGDKVGEAIVMLQDTEQGNAIHTFVSDQWPRITGYSRKELLGTSFFDLLHPRYQEASFKRHRRKMGGEIMPGLFEMTIITKDGVEVPIELTSAYTTYRGRRANVAFIRDITQRKQAEEREKELQRELNLSSRLASVGELAAGVAHEINNPLTGIMGFSERLLRKSTDKEISQGLEKIHSEAQRAARIVESLRTFARRRETKKEYLGINEILGRTLELRAYELRTGDVELAVELAPDLPDIIGDFGQIQQVFLNIILNAEQAITEANGGGRLTIKTEKRQGCIRISFTDDGPGIPAENLDKLFDPFFTTRGERGGTGLGLSACHGIVTEHGGKIYARSRPGKGATFFVELPLTTGEKDE